MIILKMLLLIWLVYDIYITINLMEKECVEAGVLILVFNIAMALYIILS